MGSPSIETTVASIIPVINKCPAAKLVESGLVLLHKNVKLLEKVVLDNDKEKVPRVFQQNNKLRAMLTTSELSTVLSAVLPASSPLKEKILSVVPLLKMSTSCSETESLDMEVDSATIPSEKVKVDDMNVIDLPEVEFYLVLLVLSLLLKQADGASAALEVATQMIARASQFNRRTLDPFTAKAYGYFSLCHQRNNSLASIRSILLAAHRTACLQHNTMAQATLLNCLLSNYLALNLYDQAEKLVSKTTFPEHVSNNQFVRYLYYVGKIQAIHLDYTEAHTKVMQATRKVPSNTAVGFRTAAFKLAIILQLLMGEVPERSLFLSDSALTKALSPYMELTNTVRTGHLVDFNTVLTTYAESFKQDKLYTLILRLRHNVIKTGLRKISLSYSRISFQDICDKLALETPQNAEFVCAKAIYDGVIDATIDHAQGWMQSKECVDVYATNEPQQAFQKRITFCLDVHNEAVKAMRYPDDAYKAELESAEERLAREKADEELQKEIEEEMEDEGM